MTKAKFITNPPQGSGFTDSFNQAMYEALVRGETPEPFPVLMIARPVGFTQKQTADGTHRSVLYDFDHAEPGRRDRGHDVDRARIMCEEWSAGRHTPQQRLPLDFGDRDDTAKKDELLRLLQIWADDNGYDLDEQWWQYFDREFVAAPDSASVVQLQEFAHARGVIADDPIVEEEPSDAEVENLVQVPAFTEPGA